MTSLRERFDLIRPYILGNRYVRRLFLLLVCAIVVMVGLRSEHDRVRTIAEFTPAPPPPGSVALDFLYNIPRGELDPLAGVEFPDRWRALAESLAGYPDSAWAGKYVRVDAGSTSVLLVSPQGFAAIIPAPAGNVVHASYALGELHAVGGVLQLVPAGKPPVALPATLPASLYAVRWGERHYLLTETQLNAEVQAVHKPGKPDAAVLMTAFIRAGDQQAPTVGDLQLPPLAKEVARPLGVGPSTR